MSIHICNGQTFINQPRFKMKMDPKLVAAKQKSEIAYIAKRFKIPAKVVREIIAETKSRSRAVIYAVLKLRGYKIGGIRQSLAQSSGM